MADIFLSYARADRARVAKLVEALQAAGFSLWWDSAIVAGASFAADIERELDAADVVVVAWSATSVKSDWVRDEANAGRDRKRLVPVQLDATPPPLGFRQLQAIDLSDWQGSAGDPRLVSLVDAIRALAGSDMANPAVPPPATSASPRPSRRLLIGAGAGVAALAAGGFGAWRLFGGTGDDGTASVVVLPFANLSGDPGQAYFSDGIAEELRNALSQIKGLKVIGRVSSEAFRDTADLPAAAEKLGVEHVLTGSVRRSPTTIRISAQLVDGKTGVESWSQSNDQPVGDALAIQNKIATSVVAALSAKLAKAAGTIAVGGTSNPQAQELFLKAEQLGRSGQSKLIMEQQLALLDTALSLDPGYADAWAIKSLVTSNSRNFARDPKAVKALLDAAAAASKHAVALAPQSGLAHLSLAIQYRNRLEMRQALAEAGKAFRLAPTDARVVSEFGLMQRSVNPDLAISITQKALSLDPLNPTYVTNYSFALVAARRYQEALVAAQQAMAMSNNQFGGNGLVSALFGLGRLQEARANLRYVSLDSIRLNQAAPIEARIGTRAASEAALEQLRKIGDGSTNMRVATVYAQRGDKELALDSLEEAYRQREPQLFLIAIVPFLDPIRNEPRFKAVQDAVIPPDLWVPPKRA